MDAVYDHIVLCSRCRKERSYEFPMLIRGLMHAAIWSLHTENCYDTLNFNKDGDIMPDVRERKKNRHTFPVGRGSIEYVRSKGVEIMTKDQKAWLNPSEGRRVSMGKYLRIQGSAANEIEKKIIQTIREFSKATGVTH